MQITLIQITCGPRVPGRGASDHRVVWCKSSRDVPQVATPRPQRRATDAHARHPRRTEIATVLLNMANMANVDTIDTNTAYSDDVEIRRLVTRLGTHTGRGTTLQ